MASNLSGSSRIKELSNRFADRIDVLIQLCEERIATDDFVERKMTVDQAEKCILQAAEELVASLESSRRRQRR